MKITDIKTTMRVWYEAYTKRGDESYFDLFNSLRTLRYAGLISDETWNKIYDYDRKLFQEFTEVN